MVLMQEDLLGDARIAFYRRFCRSYRQHRSIASLGMVLSYHPVVYFLFLPSAAALTAHLLPQLCLLCL